jgi:hypothetical protein
MMQQLDLATSAVTASKTHLVITNAFQPSNPWNIALDIMLSACTETNAITFQLMDAPEDAAYSLVGSESQVAVYAVNSVDSTTDVNTSTEKITASSHSFETGDPVIYNKTPEAVAQVQTIQCVADVADSLDGKYFILEKQDGTSHAFWYDTDDSGTTIPAGASAADAATEITGVATNDSAATVATVTEAVVEAQGFASTVSTDTITATNDNAGAVGTAPDAGDSGFTITVTYAGAAAGNADAIGGLTDGSTYYVIDSGTNDIQLATTAENAHAGTAINLTANGTGTNHQFIKARYQIMMTRDDATDLAQLPLNGYVKLTATSGVSDTATVARVINNTKV